MMMKIQAEENLLQCPTSRGQASVFKELLNLIICNLAIREQIPSKNNNYLMKIKETKFLTKKNAMLFIKLIVKIVTKNT